MSVTIDQCKYYRTAEVCALAGIHKSTLFRWMGAGIVKTPQRDRRGWRLFSENDLAQIQKEAFRITV